ncbi:sulfotransferase 6B1-like isoform X1 [Branchiostoma floridae]|uniref:Sulfotransferase n=1 Tax=Branchiostoma floridae TaxID=7739 RepID=A0A9J7LXS5_BRAFL|nr:sulfotransferase 6B1-like isoform X1 [Branchiostoma floridae]
MYIQSTGDVDKVHLRLQTEAAGLELFIVRRILYCVQKSLLCISTAQVSSRTMAEATASFMDDDNFTHVVTEGIRYPPFVTEANLEAMATFDIRDDDIAIVTFPKTGTNWMLEIITKILSAGGRTDASSDDMVGKLEFTYPHEPRPHHVMLQECASPRVILTHLTPDTAPPGIAHPQNNVKVIVVMRNPKDTAVSFFHFEQKMRSRLGKQAHHSWDEYFMQNFLPGNHPFGCYFDHILGWWERRDDPHFLFLKYEDMKQDLPKAVKTVAAILQVKLDDASIETIAHACTFSSMKSTLDNSRYDDRTLMARKGIVGDWKTMFTDEQSRLLDLKCKTKLEGTGLQFNFE